MSKIIHTNFNTIYYLHFGNSWEIYKPIVIIIFAQDPYISKSDRRVQSFIHSRFSHVQSILVLDKVSWKSEGRFITAFGIVVSLVLSKNRSFKDLRSLKALSETVCNRLSVKYNISNFFQMFEIVIVNFLDGMALEVNSIKIC